MVRMAPPCRDKKTEPSTFFRNETGRSMASDLVLWGAGIPVRWVSMSRPPVCAEEDQ